MSEGFPQNFCFYLSIFKKERNPILTKTFIARSRSTYSYIASTPPSQKAVAIVQFLGEACLFYVTSTLADFITFTAIDVFLKNSLRSCQYANPISWRQTYQVQIVSKKLIEPRRYKLRKISIKRKHLNNCFIILLSRSLGLFKM